MRRSRLATLLAGILMAAFLVPAATSAATLPNIPTTCALTVAAPFETKAAIVCRWTAPAGVTPAAYRVWRIVDGGARVAVGAVKADATLRFADKSIVPGHLYTYRIVAVDASKVRVAQGPLVSVRYARAPQALTLTCESSTVDAVAGIACKWNASTRTATTRYVLFRSVDGAARTAVYRVGVTGTRAYFDSGVTAGQVVRYGVVAFAADGRIMGVGISGPITVPVPVAPAIAAN